MQLIDLFERGLAYGEAAPCFVDASGEGLTYGQVNELSHRVANGLCAAGISKASKVGLLSSNHVLTFPAVLGIIRSPGIWLPVNARNSAQENANILSHGGCEFLFVHSDFEVQLPELRRALPEVKGIVCIDRDLPGAPGLQAWASNQSAAAFRSAAEPSDVVAIRGTGGTTGLPKGVLVTHRIYSVLFANWFASMPVVGRPVHLVVAPLSHAAGSVALATLAYGGVNVVMPTAEPRAILDAIAKHRVTQLFLPPTALYKLLADPTVKGRDYQSLRYLIYSAAPMSVDKLREALDTFGPVMVQCYGQAEAPMTCTVLTREDHVISLSDDALAHRLASCGRASPFVRMEVMDAQGVICRNGERGEIVVQGELVMQGYYLDPAKTLETIRDGWLHTGDVGYRDDDGYFYIVDRMKDIIVSGGFNIMPGEIEQVLWSHPSVNDCAVVGVPDSLWGEAVKAVIELKPGASWNEAEMLAFCRQSLGAMKTPKSIEVWDELPRSPVGKVLKREVRDRFWLGQQRQV